MRNQKNKNTYNEHSQFSGNFSWPSWLQMKSRRGRLMVVYDFYCGCRYSSGESSAIDREGTHPHPNPIPPPKTTPNHPQSLPTPRASPISASQPRSIRDLCKCGSGRALMNIVATSQFFFVFFVFFASSFFFSRIFRYGVLWVIVRVCVWH